MRSSDSAQRRAGDEDEECGTSGGEILSPELEDFLRSSVAARERAGDGDEEGGEDKDGAGKKRKRKNKVGEKGRSNRLGRKRGEPGLNASDERR